MTNYVEHTKDRNKLRTSGRSAAQPNKAKEHRYERRKVRQFMRHCEWDELARN
jgi:hypothetical protein